MTVSVILYISSMENQRLKKNVFYYDLNKTLVMLGEKGPDLEVVTRIRILILIMIILDVDRESMKVLIVEDLVIVPLLSSLTIVMKPIMIFAWKIVEKNVRKQIHR